MGTLGSICIPIRGPRRSAEARETYSRSIRHRSVRSPSFMRFLLGPSLDPPIKRFAQRHTYLGTDAIAARDLGFAMARQGGAASATGSNFGGRTETQASLNNASGSSSHKRATSPDHKRRDDRGADYGPGGYKRQRAMSPPPPPPRDRDRDRDRDRWDGPPPARRRYASPPAYERERERDAVVAPRRDRPPPPPEREEEKPVVSLPPIISWFVGTLPAPSSFDGSSLLFCLFFVWLRFRIGPVFRTDDLMQVFRNAVIPSSSSLGRRSPMPLAAATRGTPPFLFWTTRSSWLIGFW